MTSVGVCASFPGVTPFVGSSSVRIPKLVQPRHHLEDSMAARKKRVAALERKVQGKQVTLADKKKFMTALYQIESQVEEMQIQLRDLKSITKSSSFWIIG